MAANLVFLQHQISLAILGLLNLHSQLVNLMVHLLLHGLQILYLSQFFLQWLRILDFKTTKVIFQFVVLIFQILEVFANLLAHSIFIRIYDFIQNPIVLLRSILQNGLVFASFIPKISDQILQLTFYGSRLLTKIALIQATLIIKHLQVSQFAFPGPKTTLNAMNWLASSLCVESAADQCIFCGRVVSLELPLELS